MDVALVTCSQFPALVPDDQALIPALETRGFSAGPAVWGDPVVDWASFKLCVIRSTWDYHLRRDEFLQWAERVASVTTLWNPLDAVRWNTHKGYLRDLEARRMPVVPTIWLQKGDQADIEQLLAERGWQRAVVKPAVSASAHETIQVANGGLARAQAHLTRLLAKSDVMVQPYLESVEGYGERSLLFIDGELTHAVRRPPALVDEPGELWKAQSVEPAADEASIAKAILEAAGYPALYARVDLARDAEGLPRLMELELVEPSLFLLHAPQAVERLADGIARRIRAG